MNSGVISLSCALVLALAAAPLAARADTNPDFDDDAKPILRMQPGLLEYVQARFDVKDTGTAKYPGDDDRPPQPPFIFRARPVGSHGPYTLRLLIQPGGPGHILGVVDMTKVHLTAPTSPSGQGPESPVANQTPPPQAPPQTPAPAPSSQTPPPASSEQPSGPTADTPSGPILDSGSQNSSSNNSQPSTSQQPSLAPPPDPAPATP